MTEPKDSQDEKPARARVLLVDDAHLPAAAFERLREAGVDLEAVPAAPSEAVLLTGLVGALHLTPEMIEKMVHVIEPAELPQDFPRNRQGKDYECVFRRPRGRPRR